MVRPIYVPQAGRFVNFSDSASSEDIKAYIRTNFPKQQPAQAEAPAAPVSPNDDSTVSQRAMYGLVSGFTDIPGGIAALLYPAEEAAQTSAGKWSAGNRAYLQKTLNIDPTKEPTTRQMLAQGLGSAAGFLIPAGAAAKGASLLGAGARLASGVGTAAVAGEGVALGAAQRAQTIEQQLASGMQITPEQQLASQRLSGLIGASEALPMHKFFGPLTTILSKVPASKAGLVEKIISSRLAKLTKAGAEEAAQEAASGIANDLMEYGVYNPDVQIGQDILSNAGGGAFAGTVLEGVIQLAAGRKLRGARQLKADIEKEKQTNFADYSRANVALAAEELRKSGVEGSLSIEENESPDGNIRHTIMSPDNKPLADLPSADAAVQAINLYKKNTGAQVEAAIKSMPELNPIRVGGRSFNTIEAAAEAHDKIRKSVANLERWVNSPEEIANIAAERKVPAPKLMAQFKDTLESEKKTLSMFDAYFSPEPVESTAEVPAAPGPEVKVQPAPQSETVRVYHSGSVGEGKTGRWVSTNKEYASNYRRDLPLYYTDIPKTDPRVNPDEFNPGQTADAGFTFNFELTPEEATTLKEIDRDTATEAVVEEPAPAPQPEEEYTKNFSRPEDAPEPIASEEDIPEMPVGAVELPIEESRVLPDTIVDEGYVPETAIDDAPVRVEQRPSATPEELMALRTEMFGEPIGWHDMTPEQRSAYEAERDKRFPPQDVSVYTSAGPMREPAPKTLREASITGPMVKDYSPETQDWIKKVYTQLQNRLSAIVPSEVTLNFQTLIDSDSGYLVRGQAYNLESADGLKSIIDLSTGILEPGMSVEAAVKKLSETLNHEIIHVLRSKGLVRESEWKILSRAVQNTKVPGKKYTYLDKAEAVYTPGGKPISKIYENPDAVVEEAVAEMYREWVVNRNKPAEQNAVGILNRIAEFFRRIFQTIRNSRHETFFQQVESGEVGGREGIPTSRGKTLSTGATEKIEAIEEEHRKPVSQEAMFSVAPVVESDEFRNWFRKSVVVNKDGSPKTVYHGTHEKVMFKAFDPDISEFGTHFGNSRQADEFAMRLDTEAQNGGRLFPVYLSMQKPLRLKDVGNWRNDSVASQLYDKRIIDQKLLDEAVTTTERRGGDDPEIREQLREAIKKAGYDGIVYLNRMEGLNKGSIQSLDDAGINPQDLTDDKFRAWVPEAEDSYIIFDARQAKSVLNPFKPGEAKRLSFSAAPLPQYVQDQNKTLFAPSPKISFKDMLFNHAFGPGTTAKTLNTMHGQIDLSRAKMSAITRKAAAVDDAAYIAELEKIANEQATGNYQRMEADYSATAAIAWLRRSSHIMASMMLRGNLSLNYQRPGDILSATMKVTDSPDNLKAIFKVMTEPGPDSPDGEKTTKADIFKTYAVAKRGEWLRSTGQAVPRELTPQYTREAISSIEANYPEVVDAYKMYQRFNKELMTTVRDAGLISTAELGRLTNQMNYYGFIYEVYGEPLGPATGQKAASKFKLRPYTGSQHGGLVNDPMFVMIQNAQFMVTSVAKNLAATKSFELARQMGEARLLQTDEAPNELAGEQPDVMFFSKNGTVHRFAVKDPLMVTALGSDDRVNVGKFWEVLGAPAHILRESVTRDPGFMARNLMRDTLSSWITSGVNFVPVVDTLKNFTKALKGGGSFNDLSARGVVGSYDLAMQTPGQLAATFRRNNMPMNVHTITSVEGGTAAIRSLWNRLGHVSEASDAATRMAVYDACIAKGMSEAEAAMQAIELLDFTRRGGSQTLGILTKLIPFLNARIQGMDVLYQAGRAGARYAMGRSLGERDANVGKKFLVRGGMLAAISVALELMNQDDDDYKQLDDYIKNGNLLIPLKEFGLPGQFIAVPKPFEAGLLFSTFPQQMVKSLNGDASTRENADLFWGQLASTFGVNPIPQAGLPILEVITNHNFYTGLPLISEGKSRLAPELQYNTSTSQLAMMIGGLPIYYNFDTGKFGGASPIVIDKLISGYGGPVGTYLVQAVSLAMQDVADIGPERMPIELSNSPIVKSFFVDAKNKNPKVVTQAYELFRIADEANRTVSRLKQMRDTEALTAYIDENRDILRNKKYIFTLADRLNKLSAQERAIERDTSMTADEKIAAQQKLRDIRIRLASKVEEINQKLGR